MTKKPKLKPAKEQEIEVEEDRYQMDPFLVRREATLILLARRAFNRRTIIFFNEKKQCSRALILFTMFGLKAAEVHGNMSQQERMVGIEKFQSGEVDFLLCTDLVARGLDIPAVKAVLNFSFPVEPKRYLHRIGRTARAGSHGVAVTLCNEEERKDIKKLTRKLNQSIAPYMLNAKQVVATHEFIAKTLDPIIHEMDLEIQADKEIEQAYKEALRAENLVKYKHEIMSRPKSEWFTTKKKTDELKKESKKDLKNIKSNFEGQLATMAPLFKGQGKKKRDQKKDAKQAAINGSSKFANDAEA